MNGAPKHSPAPFTRSLFELPENGEGSIGIYSGERWIADVHGTHVGPHNLEEVEANFRLFVGAPGMLAALKALTKKGWNVETRNLVARLLREIEPEEKVGVEAVLAKLTRELEQTHRNESDRINKPGHVEPNTKRYCITARDYVERVEPNHPAWLYDEKAAEVGTEPWREIEGINPHVRGGLTEIWLANGACIDNADLDRPVYVQQPFTFSNPKEVR